MPKSLYIDPEVVRKSGKITFEDIPMNVYQKTVKDEVGNFTKEQLVNIYRDMLTLREFETMINLIKTTGEYDAALQGRRRLSTMDMPVTPPKEKLLGNLKKYTPRSSRSVASVRIPYSRKRRRRRDWRSSAGAAGDGAAEVMKNSSPFEGAAVCVIRI